jgi:hypothetical protein
LRRSPARPAANSEALSRTVHQARPTKLGD